MNFSALRRGPTPVHAHLRGPESLLLSAHSRYWLSLPLRPRHCTRSETRNLSVLSAKRTAPARKQGLPHLGLLLFVVSLVSFVSTTTTCSYGVFGAHSRLSYHEPLSGTTVYLQFCHSSRVQVRPWIPSAIASIPTGPAALRRIRRCSTQAAAVTGTANGQLPRL